MCNISHFSVHPIIVAEMACAHQGDVKQVYQLIDAAADAGVDVVQFQFFQAREVAVPGSDHFNLARQLELPISEYSSFIDYARTRSLKVWITPGDVVSAQNAYPCKPDFWRIHSSDIHNLSLIQYLCETGLPISFSVGGSTIEEIEFALGLCHSKGGKVELLVHGFQGYPTPVAEANLRRIKTLKDHFRIKMGYQDHTLGNNPLGYVLPAMAMCSGAEVIEKHYTLDRQQKKIDYHSSLNPQELKMFVSQLRSAAEALGSPNSEVFGVKEREYRKTFKKGFLFRRNLSAGTEITAEHLKIVRHQDLQVYGNQIQEVIGKRLRRDVKENDIVCFQILESVNSEKENTIDAGNTN